MVCASALMVLFFGTIDYTTGAQKTWDLRYYKLMADASPGVNWTILEPTVYRILGPWLAGLISHGDLGFRILGSLGSMFLGLSLFLFLTRLSIQPFFSCIGTVCFLCNKWFFGFQTWNCFQINDLLSLICIIYLFWTLFDKKWLLFAVLFLLGNMARETVLVAVPALFTFMIIKRYPKIEILKCLAALIPGLTFFLLVRIFTVPVHGRGFDYYWDAYSYYFLQIFLPVQLYHYFINSVLPLFFIPFIFFGTTRTILKENLYMVVYFITVFFCAFFGGDTERLVAPWFLFYYYIIARIFQDNFSGHTRYLYLLLLICLVASFHHTIGVFRLPSFQAMVVLSVTTLVVAAIIALRVKILQKP